MSVMPERDMEPESLGELFASVSALADELALRTDLGDTEKILRRILHAAPDSAAQPGWATESGPDSVAHLQPARVPRTRTPEAEPLLTQAEVAMMFRVDQKTVMRWAKAGKLTSIRTLGGHRKYRQSEVRALLWGTPQQRSE